MTPSELRALSLTELMALLPPDRLSDIPGAETEFSARLACQELGCSRYEIPTTWLRSTSQNMPEVRRIDKDANNL